MLSKPPPQAHPTAAPKQVPPRPAPKQFNAADQMAKAHALRQRKPKVAPVDTEGGY